MVALIPIPQFMQEDNEDGQREDRMHVCVITSQIQFAVHWHPILLPPNGRELGMSPVPHFLQEVDAQFQTDPRAHKHSYEVRGVVPVGQARQVKAGRIILDDGQLHPPLALNVSPVPKHEHVVLLIAVDVYCKELQVMQLNPIII